MRKPKPYVGLNNERYGGMSILGRMIRDAWVFGLLAEGETCEGWPMGAMDDLYNKVSTEWEKYGCLVSKLPEDLMAKHQRIHGAAFEAAKAAGWSGEIETQNDN